MTTRNPDRLRQQGGKLSSLIARGLGSKTINHSQLIPERGHPTELEVMPNRIVVFGSRISGAEDLAQRFSELLEKSDVPNPVVNFERNAARIIDVFFGRGIDGEQPKRDTLPRGVIIFPQMRQYTLSGSGMFTSGHVQYVEGLCAGNNVPFVGFNYGCTPEEIADQTTALIVPSYIPELDKE